MKNTTRVFAAVATIALLGGLSHRVQGQAYINSYVSQGADAAWNVNPTAGLAVIAFETGGTPTTGSGGNSNDNDNWGGNANGANGFGALGELFTVSQAGMLSSAQMVFDGGRMSFNVELYDLGPTPVGYNTGVTTPYYPAIKQINALTTAVAASSGGVPSPGYTLNGGLNLLASSTFTYNAVAGTDLVTAPFLATPSNPNEGVTMLQTGELYLLSVDPTANADSTWWVRGAVPITTYNQGEGVNADGVDGMQAFEGKTSSERDFDLAITETPEPSTIALGVIGLSSLLLRRRK
jgi:hypothetical protein